VTALSGGTEARGCLIRLNRLTRLTRLTLGLVDGAGGCGEARIVS